MRSWLETAPPEEVDAGSLRLRRWRVADAEAMARLIGANIEHLRPWMPWAQRPPTVDEEREFIRRMHEAWEARTDFAYAATLPDGEPIGGVGLHTRQGPPTLEIGYWIAASHTRRGLATVASRALTDIAFDLPGVARVEIRCDPANQASAAIPPKLGFHLMEIINRPAMAPAETGRGMIWAIAKSEWRPAPTPARTATRPGGAPAPPGRPR